MTNYNERLDKALKRLAVAGRGWGVSESAQIESMSSELDEAKEAITSLIKELVAEAKPPKKDQLAQSTLDDESRCRFYRYGGYNFALDQFERNLLKELEEK